MDGRDVFLQPKLALSMALLLHELATNASKYGSLSVATGQLTVQWSVVDNRLTLQWRESGGPTVVEPTRHGAGTKLIKAMLTALGGEIDTRFDPAGLIVQMGLHLSDSAPPSTS